MTWMGLIYSIMGGILIGVFVVFIIEKICNYYNKNKFSGRCANCLYLYTTYFKYKKYKVYCKECSDKFIKFIKE